MIKDSLLTYIVQLTEQRDCDALDYCVLTTIAEALPVQQVSMCEIRVDPTVLWYKSTINNNNELIEPSKNQQLNFNRHQFKTSQFSIENKNKDHYQLLIPIFANQELLAVIEIISLSSLANHEMFLQGVCRIYQNYKLVLLESERDTLTSLYNRKSFEQKLGKLLQNQAQHQRNRRVNPSEKDAVYPWIVMLDIDHFKQVNDQYGHIYGDEVLLVLAQLMRQSFRYNDLLFRFGGEEFVIVLEPISTSKIEKVLERFRCNVAGYEFPMIGHITVSMGYEKISYQCHPREILEKADKALYYAKNNGRNCFFHYQKLIESGELTEVKHDGEIELF